MRIVASSDFHGQLPDIPACDLFIIGGDICPDGDIPFQADWIKTQLRPWLAQLPAKEIIGIAGNHDFIFENSPHEIPSNLRWHYLQDSEIILEGVKIYGMPWQLPYFGVFNLSEKEIAKHYDKIPPGMDIIISHGPPYGIGDMIPYYLEESNEMTLIHTGSITLREKMFSLKPKLCLFGHIHSAAGIYKMHETIFANISLLDDDLKRVRDPFIFDIEF